MDSKALGIPADTGEKPEKSERPTDDQLRAINNFNALFAFFRDPKNKETKIYTCCKDPNSPHFNKPYLIYLNASGCLECKSVDKPPHVIELNSRSPKSKYFLLTPESFGIIEKHEKESTFQTTTTGKIVRQYIEDIMGTDNGRKYS